MTLSTFSKQALVATFAVAITGATSFNARTRGAEARHETVSSIRIRFELCDGRSNV